MTKRRYLAILGLAVICLTIGGCTGGPKPEPTPDLAATVAAQVGIALTTSAKGQLTATPAPTTDVAATVMAGVAATAAAQPSSTPYPTYTPAPMYTLPPQPTATCTSRPSAIIAPTAESTVVATSGGEIPSGKWMVRSYNTDDAAAIFVNGILVGASVSGGNRSDTNWININNYLLPGQDTVVAVASYNGGYGGKWGFSLRRDDITVWGSEQNSEDDWALSYAQQIVIHPDGTVEPLPQNLGARKPPPGKWFVRVQSVQDIGAILVNGQPVAVNWDRKNDWIDVTGLLYSDQDNKITFAAWNFDGPYAWDFAVKRDENILWGKRDSNSGAVGSVFQESVTLSSKGDLVDAQPTEPAVDDTWSVRSYNTDDAAAIFVNGILVGASVSGGNRSDTDWININNYLLPGQDTVVAVASYNGGYGGKWGFSLRRDDITVWGSEQNSEDDWALSYAQQIVIHPDGTVEPLPQNLGARKPPPGKWFVRVQSVQDIGAILVNGQPVAVNWDRKNDWIDVTGLLYSDQDNKITFAAWNFDGPYAWDFAVKRDENILWAVSNTGSGQTGVVFSQEVIISEGGAIR